MYRILVRMNEDGTPSHACLSGHEMPDAKVIKWERFKNISGNQLAGEFIVLKVPGHSYWTGNFMPRGYAPTEYKIYKVESLEQDAGLLQILNAVEILEFPCRSKAETES